MTTHQAGPPDMRDWAKQLDDIARETEERMAQTDAPRVALSLRRFASWYRACAALAEPARAYADDEYADETDGRRQ